jgi:hypothetical protein
MEDKISESVTGTRSFIAKHSFLMFITLSILISAAVVYTSMQMYNSSGAAQLDLSRPGYVSVRSKVDVSDGDLQAYPANGQFSKNVIDNFKSLFKKQAQKIKTIDAFGGSPLDDAALGISDTSTQ